MKKMKIVLSPLLFLMLFSIFSLLLEAKRERSLNPDIVISNYETIVLEQGESKVRPVFRVKNTGKRTYISIQVNCKKPQGLSDKGQVVYLQYHIIPGDSITLKAGQVDTLIPGRKSGGNIGAHPEQEITTYSTDCWFEYADVEGHLYRSPFYEIKNFVRVIPFQKNIELIEYKTLVAEQGKGNIFPLFKLKNKGNRIFREVSLHYESPRTASSDNKNKSSIRIVGARWAGGTEPEQVSLRPDQEAILNSGSKNGISLDVYPNQAVGIYFTWYWFEYQDDNGHHFRTPKYELKEFVKVIPINEYLVLTGFKTIELMQGEGRVEPVLLVKNTGSHTFEKVKIVFDHKIIGKDSRGKEDRLIVGNNASPLESVGPGQELRFNPHPGGLPSFSVSARPNQLETFYQVNYRFEYTESDGTRRITPNHTIENFVRVIPYNKDIILTGFTTRIEAEWGKRKGPSLVPGFSVKNVGQRIYTALEIEYELPDGFVKDAMGKLQRVRVDFDKRKGIKPGQEVNLSPASYEHVFNVKPKDLSRKVFSTRYCFRYYDARNHSYETPKFTLEKFVVLKD